MPTKKKTKKETLPGKGAYKTKKPEELFKGQLEDNKLYDYLTQYKFHDTRRWRFDFAFPVQKIAIEVMGGVWIRGGHVTGSGFTKDSEKLNEAQILGWHVLYITSNMVRDGSGLDYLKRLLKQYDTKTRKRNSTNNKRYSSTFPT